MMLCVTDHDYGLKLLLACFYAYDGVSVVSTDTATNSQFTVKSVFYKTIIQDQFFQLNLGIH